MIIPSNILPPIIPPHGQVAIEPVKKTDPENRTGQEFNSEDSPDQNKQPVKTGQEKGESTQPVSAGNKSAGQGAAGKPGLEQNITPEERAEVEQMTKRDREVRAHEAAHKGAAGQYGGSVQLDYKRGPDGKLYAVSGEVSIDSGRPGDPQEALRKAQTIRRAALAPANPSSQDRAVAAKAAQMATQARVELQLGNTIQNPAGADKVPARLDPASRAYQANTATDQGKQQQVDIIV